MSTVQDSTLAPTGYRLRIPGPVPVPEVVRTALARPVVAHRGPYGRAQIARIQELIRPVFGTHNPVLTLASSGTGAMEAGLLNVIAPGDRVLVVVQGQFGDRYAAIAAALGAVVDKVEFPWGEAAQPAIIAERLAAADYRALVITHNESSTGIENDLAAIGALVRDRDTLVVVDSVSGLAGTAMRMDDWGLDVVVSASQKALMCPPGMGLIGLSDRAIEAVKRDSGMPRFFFDLRRALAVIDDDQTPFTPPVSLNAGLCAALELIHEEGLDHVFARHRRCNDALLAGCAALGFEPFGQHAARSRTVVALSVPGNLDGGQIIKELMATHRTVVAGARNHLSGRMIRLGTMGQIGLPDVMQDILDMGATLARLGHARDVNAALAAALQAYDNG